jgi:hypothetical protein
MYWKFSYLQAATRARLNRTPPIDNTHRVRSDTDASAMRHPGETSAAQRAQGPAAAPAEEEESGNGQYGYATNGKQRLASFEPVPW